MAIPRLGLGGSIRRYRSGLYANSCSTRQLQFQTRKPAACYRVQFPSVRILKNRPSKQLQRSLLGSRMQKLDSTGPPWSITNWLMRLDGTVVDRSSQTPKTIFTVHRADITYTTGKTKSTRCGHSTCKLLFLYLGHI